MRGNQLHPPRSTKINIPAASAPRTEKLYHFPSPSVNGAIGTGEGFGRRQQGAPDPLVPVGITPTPQEGSTDTPPEGNTDNPLVGIPTHPLSVLPTYPQVVLPTAPKGVLPKTPKGSGDCPQKVVGTIYRRLNNSPTAPFQRSAVHQATLRRTFDNSPPYFDASRAESRVKQGGEFRHIGRRFSPWTTEILIEQGGVMADVTKGIARTAPLNAWNDGKTAVLRQSPQPPEQARGV